MTNGRSRGDGHTFRVAAAWRDRCARPAVLFDLEREATLVHASARSRVAIGTTSSGRLVVKRSVRQETSRWLQFTGWWRDGEGVRTFDVLEAMRADGLPVPEPVAALDERRGGLVVSSVVAYRYVDGEPGSCEHAPAIARLIEAMHARGWVHRDPHVRNFLCDGERVSVIDCASVRRRTTAYARAYDFVLLAKCCPAWQPPPDLRARYGTWYTFAACGSLAMVAWRRLKGVLRRLARQSR